ncbi:MAG: phosphate/phosphite/phosphonate ABC transporter substrate-binding protein [Pseudomonadota bacterium]
MGRFINSTIVFAFSLMGLAACSSGNGSDNSSDLEGWRAEVGVVKMGTRAPEEDPVRLQRWETYTHYMSEATGLPVKAYEASDYNGIIQAFASGQISLANVAPGNYANIDSQIGELAQPLLAPRNTNGESGYYSSLVVRADSPYQSIEDLEGKTVAFVDFNSTSGYIYPKWFMRKSGFDPDYFFGETAISGGHLQGMMALANGQFDATLLSVSNGNPELGFASGTLRRIARRGVVEFNDYREIWYAGPIPRTPVMVRADRPEAFKDLVRGAMASIPYEDPQTAIDMGRLPGHDYQPVNREHYTEIFEMRDAEIAQHRTRLSARKTH